METDTAFGPSAGAPLDANPCVAVTRGTPLEDGGYMWRGELRLWPTISGWGTIARTEDEVRGLMDKLRNEEKARAR